MQPQTETETTQPTQRENERSGTEWLEALVAGKCDREVLLRSVAGSLTADSDAGWELLSLVDQYYRRRQISLEDFKGLNSQLQALLVGDPRSDDVGRAPAASTPKPRPNITGQTQAPEIKQTPPSPQRTTVAGEVLCDRYHIQGILGRGGMGTVYAAIDQYRLDDADGGQKVAIKVLHTEIIKRPQLLKELRGEFQRLQALSHPNIVRVHEFSRDGDLAFFTMEHLSGAPLSRVLAERNSVALQRPHALAIIRQVGAAVAYGHSRGIVHGDLNPGNIFITDVGDVRVLDFGASHRLRPDPSIPQIDDPSRTAVATPSYASCELLVGTPPDARDDVYALACISYVLLTGEHPFQGRTALMARTQRLTPRRPSGVSNRQWRALQAGLQSDRKDRPADMQVWLTRLNVLSNPAPLPSLSSVRSAPPPRIGAARWAYGGLIAALVVLCWWAQANTDLMKRASAGLGATLAELRNDIRPDTPVARSYKVAAQTLRSKDAPRLPPAAPPTPPTVASSPVVSAQVSPGVSDAIAAQTQTAEPSRARIELAADLLEVAPMQPFATVLVHRRHSYRSSVSFTWWTESGTARPGQDFTPVSSAIGYIPAGDNETRLPVPIVADPLRRVSRTFYVVIGDPSDGAVLGSRTLTMVTIPASE